MSEQKGQDGWKVGSSYASDHAITLVDMCTLESMHLLDHRMASKRRHSLSWYFSDVHFVRPHAVHAGNKHVVNYPGPPVPSPKAAVRRCMSYVPMQAQIKFRLLLPSS